MRGRWSVCRSRIWPDYWRLADRRILRDRKRASILACPFFIGDSNACASWQWIGERSGLCGQPLNERAAVVQYSKEMDIAMQMRKRVVDGGVEFNKLIPAVRMKLTWATFHFIYILFYLPAPQLTGWTSCDLLRVLNSVHNNCRYANTW